MAAKHPKGLYVLFFTEMWERFGYYLMLAIFTLYLNEHLKMSEGDSASLYGTYIGLVYLSPLFGGILADKVIGYRRSVLAGALLLSIGRPRSTSRSEF
jgi:POT family proton-dependent oligopeptide transporter